MDYKLKNKEPPVWTFEQFAERCEPEPFDCCTAGNLTELTAPDGSTAFLLRQSQFDEEHGFVVFYGIEAPRSSPARRAFEIGQLSWFEYWTQTEWLLRITRPFEPGPIVSTYITPAEIDTECLENFKHLGARFPYELKREQLELHWENAPSNGRNPRASAKEYQNFMLKHGHLFRSKAA